jgi:oligoribonuclease NrnB/cAMP/cGMP phosphodiesterase (DHH superfamily)
MDHILYHNDCNDGWVAAYIAKTRYPQANLIPLNHGAASNAYLHEFVRGTDVLMVDFSLGTRAENDRLASACRSFRILDHHRSAQAILKDSPYATFDMNRSGAGLTWDVLFSDFGGVRPWWVDYTEDQDLWNFKLPDSKSIGLWLMIQPRFSIGKDITQVDALNHWNSVVLPMRAPEAAILGKSIRQYMDYYTETCISTGLHEGVYGSLRAAVLNVPLPGISESCAAAVNKGFDVAFGWFEREDGVIKFSVYSKKDGDVDVSQIARRYNGGGHQSAAGFQLPIEQGRRLIDDILKRDAK